MADEGDGGFGFENKRESEDLVRPHERQALFGRQQPDSPSALFKPPPGDQGEKKRGGRYPEGTDRRVFRKKKSGQVFLKFQGKRSRRIDRTTSSIGSPDRCSASLKKESVLTKMKGLSACAMMGRVHGHVERTTGVAPSVRALLGKISLRVPGKRKGGGFPKEPDGRAGLRIVDLDIPDAACAV